MKILSIPISYFITAIVVGIALSFLLASTVFAPNPVDTPVQEITPVPTPREVYVYVHATETPAPTQEQTTVGLREFEEVPPVLSTENPILITLVILSGFFLLLMCVWVLFDD